jgi:sulfatase modifying factor 1
MPRIPELSDDNPQGAATMSLHVPLQTPNPSTAPGPAPDKDMIWIPGGTFMMGSNEHYPEEAPAHAVTVSGFWIDRSQVTNAAFRRFVKATGYVTVAERVPDAAMYPGALPEMLVAGSVVFKQPPGRVPMNTHYNWWDWMPSADWRHPEGPGSTLNGRERHPVLHVAWEDINAYAEWAGKAIPTEAEWEYAARGGHDGWPFAWGQELAPKGKMLANYWQGEFPWQNLKLDGYERTAPVSSFPPNDYGLYDMIGNAWEWTTDWYGDRHEVTTACCSAETINPRGGAREASVDPREPGSIPRKVLKGGSFACAENYCQRYRPAARMHHPIDTGTNHISFRCVVRVEGDG